tara:strand:- start:11660 stop:12301 length:642 start_codon:yes stop_codon:yes gene_type:complete
MQPTYLPWLGYFDLMKSSDVFVFLDHVQFSKQSWQQRNKIRDKNGEQMLTVSVKKPSEKDAQINEIVIDHNRKSLIKHLKSIKSNYGKSKNFKEIYPKLEEIYSKEYKLLVDLNVELINLGCKEMEFHPEIVFSSTLNIETKKVEGIIEICSKVEADHYLSPVGAQGYIEENNIFSENNISLSFQEYSHPLYEQINYKDFISHLSFIDYLLNK